MFAANVARTTQPYADHWASLIENLSCVGVG
jgi:hypothetical protein